MCARIMFITREMKMDKHMKRMTLGNKNIKNQGDIGALIAHVETAKALLNIISSRKNAKFMILHTDNFYIMTPMKDCECLRKKLSTMSEQIIKEHNMHNIYHNSCKACLK